MHFAVPRGVVLFAETVEVISVLQELISGGCVNGCRF